MALTVVVRSAAGTGPELAITFDAPRVVLGRSEGCEMRLPDATVSQRHASLRQKSAEWVLYDEGSENGTFLGPLRLPPQTAHVVRSGEVIRLGRVWLEVRIAPGQPSPATAAKDLALELVCRGLRAQGEEPGPLVTVVEGPDAGATISLREPGRAYTLGRAKDLDLVLADPAAARRHASLVRRGDGVVVQVLTPDAQVTLDGGPAKSVSFAWKAGHELGLGANLLSLAFPAVDVLAEMERGAVERVEETPEPPPDLVAPSPEPPAATVPAVAVPPTNRPPAPPVERRATPRQGWVFADGAVVLLALGVLVASLIGGWWLLAR